VLWISLHVLSETLLIPRGTEQDMVKHVYRSTCNVPVILSNFNETSTFLTDYGLVVRVSGYRYRGPGFNSRRYQIFCVVVGLERVPLSLVRSIEELLE
jgi:hypothetical protein